MSERIQEIRDEIKRIENADGVLFWPLLKVAKKAADLLETLEREIQEHENWIPCAEGMRTPEDGQFVNVTYEHCGDLKSSSATYHKLSGNYYGCDKYGSMMLGVLAWQPLPELYNPDHIVDANKMMEEPKPLMLSELAGMEGKPVYDGNENCWRVIESVYVPDEDYAVDSDGDPHTVISFTDGTEMDFDLDYYYLYARDPKGANRETTDL